MSVHGVSDNKHLKEIDPISHKTLLLALCVCEWVSTGYYKDTGLKRL